MNKGGQFQVEVFFASKLCGFARIFQLWLYHEFAITVPGQSLNPHILTAKPANNPMPHDDSVHTIKWHQMRSQSQVYSSGT